MKLVEIELHSYCNRKCNWCPNRFLDRTSPRVLDENIYLSLLDQLAELNYTGTISFSRYNEPLALIELFHQRLKQVRAVLPNCKLVTNTNGDFLTTLDFDIDELSIMDYDCKGAKYWTNRLEQLGAKDFKFSANTIRCVFNQMLILVELNWSQRFNIEDRGGLLRTYDLQWKRDLELRTARCFEPVYFIGINFDGTVSPCCHIRSDAEMHSPFIIGDLAKESLDEILKGSIRSAFINQAVTAKNFSEPCKYCQKDPGRYTKDHGGIYS